VVLLAEGHGPGEVARMVGVDRRSVRRWKAAYRHHGAQALRARRAPGRPPKLAPRRLQQVERVLLKGAKAAGFGTELWTCPRIAQVLARRFGVSTTWIISAAASAPSAGVPRSSNAARLNAMSRPSKGGSRRRGRALKKSHAPEGVADLSR
jgi:transposase